MHRTRSGLKLIRRAALFGLVLAVGCGESEQIVSYTVPKEPPRPKIAIETSASTDLPAPSGATSEPGDFADPATGPDRMLGGIVTRPDQTWFFKLTGAEAPVTAAREPFVNFLKTVEFTGAEGNPTWKLPDGWTEGPPRQMRFATLMFESEGAQLELAISSLPSRGADPDEFLLANLNRWRGQMSLPNSTLETIRQTAGELETIDLPGGNQATISNLRGKLKAGGMGAAPFAR